jgi:Na+/pantothenate symporter
MSHDMLKLLAFLNKVGHQYLASKIFLVGISTIKWPHVINSFMQFYEDECFLYGYTFTQPIVLANSII